MPSTTCSPPLVPPRRGGRRPRVEVSIPLCGHRHRRHRSLRGIGPAGQPRPSASPARCDRSAKRGPWRMPPARVCGLASTRPSGLFSALVARSGRSLRPPERSGADSPAPERFPRQLVHNTQPVRPPLQMEVQCSLPRFGRPRSGASPGAPEEGARVSTHRVGTTAFVPYQAHRRARTYARACARVGRIAGGLKDLFTRSAASGLFTSTSRCGASVRMNAWS